MIVEESVAGRAVSRIGLLVHQLSVQTHVHGSDLSCGSVSVVGGPGEARSGGFRLLHCLSHAKQSNYIGEGSDGGGDFNQAHQIGADTPYEGARRLGKVVGGEAGKGVTKHLRVRRGKGEGQASRS